MIERCRQRIEVTARVGAQALNLLKRRVVGRVPKKTRGSRRARKVSRLPFCETKIQQNDLSSGGEFQVLRFDIAVNDLRVLRMQIIERIKQLVRRGKDLIRRKRSAPLSANRRQIVSCDVLHHEKLSVTFRKVVTNARERRMMQTGQQTCFPFKLLSQLFLCKQSFLQRDGGIQSLINGLVDCAHAALSKQSHDTIPTLQDCLWRKH